MAYNKVNDIIIEDAQIRFENFSGKEQRNPNNNRVINVEGNRNFCVVINHEDAQRLVDEGWNVKCKLPKEEGDEPFCYLSVAVAFNRIPPKVIMVSGGEQTQLNEETICCLDGTRFKNVDLQINPSFWVDDDGNTRIKAYLRTGYFEIEEDVFAYKYK